MNGLMLDDPIFELPFWTCAYICMGVCVCFWMNDKKRYWDLFHFVYGSRFEENIIVGPIQFAFQNEDASTIVLLVTIRCDCILLFNYLRIYFFCVFVFRRRTKLNSVWKFARYFLFFKVFDFQRCPMLSVTSLSAPQKCNSVVLKMVENNPTILVQSKWNFWFLGRINCECFFCFGLVVEWCVVIVDGKRDVYLLQYWCHPHGYDC